MPTVTLPVGGGVLLQQHTKRTFVRTTQFCTSLAPSPIMCTVQQMSCTLCIAVYAWCALRCDLRCTVQALQLFVTWGPLVRLKRYGRLCSMCTCQQQTKGSCPSQSLPWSLSPPGTALRPHALITINRPSAFASPLLFFLFPPSSYTLLLRWDSQAAMKLLLTLEKRRWGCDYLGTAVITSG